MAKIEVVPHGPEWHDAVEAFNNRMRDGGSRWGFYVEHLPEWIPKRRGLPVWREYHLAVEEGDTVRGAYALKPQDWLIRGEVRKVTDWQGPFSEGAYSRRYAALGLRLVRDMLKKYPLLYSWGHGDEDEPMVQMLRKMGWLMHPTPLCVKVLRPARFLRRNGYLRNTAKRRALLDVLALSGAGSVGVRALHTALRLRSPLPVLSQAQVEREFGPWADVLWARCKGDYAAIAIRDALTLNTLMPHFGWPPVIRLRVTSGGEDVGWAAVMDSEMRGDTRFGDLRLGSVVDCLARPDDAIKVVAAATRYLASRGVDLVVSNQAHPAWGEAFRKQGYLLLQDKRIFAASPELKAAMEPWEETRGGLHLTNMDGHGPMTL